MKQTAYKEWCFDETNGGGTDELAEAIGLRTTRVW